MTAIFSLLESQRLCREIVDKSGSSFRRSFAFLRSDAQTAMNTLYAFARLTDDLADEEQFDQKEAARTCAWLHSWIDRPELNEDAFDVASLPLANTFQRLSPALLDMMQRFELDPSNLHDLIRGAEFDLQSDHQLETDEHMLQYCRWVASSVGLACIHIWRGDVQATKSAAMDCGIAFQITNILRDVAEDARRGRIYFPNQALEKFQCSRLSWLASKPDGDWRALLRQYIAIANQHYIRGKEIYRYLPYDGQRMFSLIWRSYHSLLNEIERRLDNVWQERIRLSRSQKVRLYLQHAVSPWFARNPLRMESL